MSLDSLLKRMAETIQMHSVRIATLQAQSERAEQAGAVKVVLFANLPAASKRGRLLFCRNCLKVGEIAGSGTGTVVYTDGTAWRRVGDDTTASA